jgi:hypothetical protein
LEEEQSQLRLQVQFKRKETVRAAAARKKAEEKQAIDDEPWTGLTFLEKTVKNFLTFKFIFVPGTRIYEPFRVFMGRLYRACCCKDGKGQVSQ